MYADSTDYEKYISPNIPENINILLEQASDQVDLATFNRIRGVGFINLTNYQQEMIKKAVCHQVQYKAEYGSYEGISSFSAGSISVSLNTGNMLNGQTMSKIAADSILSTGLASRNISWRR